MSEQDYVPGTSVISNLVGRTATKPHGTPDQRVLDAAVTFFVSTRMAELLREGPAVVGDAATNPVLLGRWPLLLKKLSDQTLRTTAIRRAALPAQARALTHRLMAEERSTHEHATLGPRSRYGK